MTTFDWKAYESEKRTIAERNLSAVEYEREIIALLARLELHNAGLKNQLTEGE